MNFKLLVIDFLIFDRMALMLVSRAWTPSKVITNRVIEVSNFVTQTWIRRKPNEARRLLCHDRKPAYFLLFLSNTRSHGRSWLRCALLLKGLTEFWLFIKLKKNRYWASPLDGWLTICRWLPARRSVVISLKSTIIIKDRDPTCVCLSHHEEDLSYQARA